MIGVDSKSSRRAMRRSIRPTHHRERTRARLSSSLLFGESDFAVTTSGLEIRVEPDHHIIVGDRAVEITFGE